MTSLVPRGTHLPTVPGDYVHLRTIVEVQYPVRSARTYLNRHLGNRVSIHLVEARRNERIGFVRAVQVNPAVGGEPVIISGLRVLPDGEPASDFVPDELVTIRAQISTGDGRAPKALDPKDEIVLHIPVRGYLRFLPGAFQGAVPLARKDVVKADEVSIRRWGAQDEVATTEVRGQDAEAMRRFLFIFQQMMTGVVDRIDQIASLTDPLTCDPRFLPWIASWVGFTLDESLPVHQQRELVRRAIRLYRMRGTREGLEEMIRVLTAAPVSCAAREKPRAFVLGKATLAGGNSLPERYLREEPGAYFLYPPERPATAFFGLVLERRDRFEQRFSQRAPSVLRRISQVVTSEKPAHVTFTVRFAED